MNDDPAETSGIELSAEEFFTHPVYAHAVKRVGYRGQGTDDFKLASNTRLMQRPRAVFTARPCDEGFERSRHGIQSVAGRVRAGIAPQTL